jgi:hypothetical protein
LNPELLSGDRELVLHPRKLGNVAMLVVSAVFVAGGAWMIQSGEPMGWFVAIFFALGLVVFPILLLPGAAYLLINRDGFTFCSLYKKNSLRWSDVDQFFVLEMRTGGIRVNKMVVFNYAPDYPKWKRSRVIVGELVGAEGGLPDTYGMKAEELAAFLNECKRLCTQPTR